MSRGIDTGTSQRNLDFRLARSQGYESCYVKLGGDNSGRYVAPYYVAEVDKARSAGMRVGHYWVVNGRMDPISAADYFVNNLRGWTSSDFVVLDNEPLDGATMLSDGQAAQWINRVKSRLNISGSQIIQYLGLSYARSQSWPASLATGCNFLIAAYGYAPWTFALPTIPWDRAVGHQYSSSVSIGGIVTDTNDWKANAFDYAATAGSGTTPLASIDNDKEENMKLIWDTIGTGYLITQDGVIGLPSMQVYNLFWRVINSDQKSMRPDTFLRAEMDIMNAHLNLLALSVNTQVAIDVDKLAKTLSEALGSMLDPQVTLDPAMLAAALDIAVPKIAAAVTRDAAAIASAAAKAAAEAATAATNS